MRNIFVCAWLTVALLSCGIQELDGNKKEGSIHTDIWGGPVEGQNGVGVLQPVCYMTVVDYKDGYDWRSDMARGNVKCSLVVYADGVPVMKVPVGDVHEISSDPDMHRIIDGHLYTDFSSDSETIIKKDGKPLFRYPGREFICGMAVSGEDVYTLGQSRDGLGFSYRKNGEAVLERARAHIIGEFREDKGSLCFAFSEDIRTSDGDVARYYRVVDGKVCQMDFAGDVVSIYDIYATSDDAYYIAIHEGDRYPGIYHGLSKVAEFRIEKMSILSGTLYVDDQDIMAGILYRTEKGVEVSYIWDGLLPVSAIPEGLTVSSFQLHGDGDYSYVANPVSSSSSGVIFWDGRMDWMPEGYAVMGGRALCMEDGVVHAGLSSLNGEKPLLWKGGKVETLDVNGYISAVYWE